MNVEYQTQGYWLASGYHHGRLVLAEGETRHEAFNAWLGHLYINEPAPQAERGPMTRPTIRQLRAGLKYEIAQYEHLQAELAKANRGESAMTLLEIFTALSRRRRWATRMMYELRAKLKAVAAAKRRAQKPVESYLAGLRFGPDTD